MVFVKQNAHSLMQRSLKNSKCCFSSELLINVCPCVFKVSMVEESVYPFPTVDVPDHAHYTIGAVILTVGITGMLGNFLVIYAFSR